MTNTYTTAHADLGWWTFCRRSPIRNGEPRLVASRHEYGWEPARERTPREGYTYACRHTSTKPGGPKSAEWQYWSLWRRPTRLVELGALLPALAELSISRWDAIAYRIQRTGGTGFDRARLERAHGWGGRASAQWTDAIRWCAGGEYARAKQALRDALAPAKGWGHGAAEREALDAIGVMA